MASRFARIRSYELMVIFHPEVEEEALGELIGRVQSNITDFGGTVTVVNRETPWGRRRLAYPIRHESRDLRDGIYVLIYFDTEASRTVEIERELKLNTRIIRHMLIQQSTPTMEPPAPVEAAAPSQDGAAAAIGTAVPSEVSPGTPPEATPTPAEPTVPEAAGPPAASEENLTAPVLDSSPEPSLPSEVLPPSDVSLVDIAAGSDVAPEAAAPEQPADEAPQATAESAEAAADDSETPDADMPATTPSP